MDFVAIFSKIMSWLSSGAVFLGTLSILVILHEWGHFILARLAGVRVHEFSMGMGKLLFHKRWGDTDYQFRLIPIGGYIRMAGEDALQQPDYVSGPDEFYGVSVYRRLAIVLGGPVMNLILAVLAIWVVYSLVAATLWRPILGYLPEDGIAYQSGLRPGDQIVAINEEEIESFSEVQNRVLKSAEKPLTFKVKREGDLQQFVVVPRLGSGTNLLGKPIELGTLAPLFDKNDPVERVLFNSNRSGLFLHRDNTIGMVFPGKPAAKAGLQAGDQIIRIDNKPIQFWDEMQNLIFKNPDKSLEIEWLRGDQQYSSQIVPEAGEVPGEKPKSTIVVGLIGMQSWADETYSFQKHYNMWEAHALVWREIYKLTSYTYQSIPMLITGKLSSDNMAGPVRIAGLIDQSAKLGFFSWLHLVGVISLMLTLFNLLPIPMLDGGHVLYFCIEIGAGWLEKLVRRPLIQKPLNSRLIHILNQVGVTALLLLFLFVTYQDVLYLFGSGK